MARILQVCNTGFYLERFLAPLVHALIDAGHVVECVCEGERPGPDFLHPSVVVRSLDFPRTGSPAAFLRSIGEMRSLIANGRYDCVDGHNRNASVVSRVAAFLEDVPVNLYTAHGFYFHDDQSPVAHALTVALESLLARITDYTLSQSSEDVRYVTGRGLILPHRIEPIGNGIDTRRFTRDASRRTALEEEFGLRARRFRIAATGRLVKGKGFDDLLDACARVRSEIPEIELLIIGGNIEQDVSPYRAEFTERARGLGFSDSLVVTGITSAVEHYLATADAFVLPSYREGMPRALLEAMSMALPVVATNIRGCSEIVVDGQSGLLYEPHDVSRLSELLRALHADPALRHSLGARSREAVVSEFDERDYVARQVRAINRLVGAPWSGSVRPPSAGELS